MFFKDFTSHIVQIKLQRPCLSKVCCCFFTSHIVQIKPVKFPSEAVDERFIFTSHIVQIKQSCGDKFIELYTDFTSHIVQIKPKEELTQAINDYYFTSHIVQIKRGLKTEEDYLCLLYIPHSSDKTVLA